MAAALQTFGRGGSGTSTPLFAPGGICCQVAIPLFVEPTFRAGQFPADVLYEVACMVSVDGLLSALCVHCRHSDLLWSLLPHMLDGSLSSMSRHSHTVGDAHQTASVIRTVYGSFSFMRIAAACRDAWA
jgi:hypothetical protein